MYQFKVWTLVRATYRPPQDFVNFHTEMIDYRAGSLILFWCSSVVSSLMCGGYTWNGLV